MNRPARKVTPAAQWRRRYARKGRTWTILAANLPNKSWLRRTAQVAWVRAKMVRVDAMTIAECTPELAGRIGRLRGVRVTSAHPNAGGNGNVIVTKAKPIRGEYRTIYTALNGHHVTLNMARAIITKGRTELTVDAVHFPSRGGYPKSSSTREQRARVVRQVAEHKAVTADRVFAGDINDEWRWVLGILRDVDKRWQHLGGDGVEHVFGIVSGRTLGQRMLRYGRASDHKRTSRVSVGILNRK